MVRPARDDRSGKVTERNVKPCAFCDDARYALGIAEPGRGRQANLMHEAFLDLIDQAVKKTGDQDFALVSKVLRKGIPNRVLEKIHPRDIVSFAIGTGGTPVFEKQSAKRFWADYLEQMNTQQTRSYCSACGSYRRTVTKLATDVIVSGQPCKLTSFNKSAFTSFGKEQTANASICYECGTRAALALNHLLKNRDHNRVLFGPKKGAKAKASLQKQVATFWLKRTETVKVDGSEVSLLELLSAPLRGKQREPVQTLSLLRRLLSIPWTGAKSTLRVDENAFFLAVVSANKGRLVVRDWIASPLVSLRDSLGAFIRATSIATVTDEEATFTIPALVDAIEDSSGDIGLALIKTAYRGHPPPPKLMASCLKVLRSPGERRRLAGAVFAAIKLALTFTTRKEVMAMSGLNKERRTLPYLCGRLLAILERIQSQASGSAARTTIADRYYGAASTSPGKIFGILIKLAQTAHLPKIRKERRGYSVMKQVLGDVLSKIDLSGGFPRVLDLAGQAEFALGFYHQSLAFYKGRALEEFVTEET